MMALAVLARLGARLRVALFAAVLVLACLVSLAVASGAQAYVYWANLGDGAGRTIGRANLDGSAVNQSFITTASGPSGVAVDGAHIYWTNRDYLACCTTAYGSIGRANLDGSGINQNFITHVDWASGVAVDGAHIYWASMFGGSIGRANLDGSENNENFITGANEPQGVAVDATSGAGQTMPTSKDQCKHGGWRNYPGFKNQGDCVSYVATHGKNSPGG